MALDQVLATIHRDIEKSIERLYALLKIPSVSTDPAYRKDCERAAAWLAQELSALGLKADVRATQGLPMVIAHYDLPGGEAQANKPHVLFYGHYDVQPPDPLDEWKTPPFEP